MSAFATAAEHAQRGQELRALHSVHSAGGPPAAAAPAGATAQVRMPLALVCGSHGGSVEPCLVLQLWARRIWSLKLAMAHYQLIPGGTGRLQPAISFPALDVYVGRHVQPPTTFTKGSEARRKC